jgi:hypothetical protein
VRVLGRSSRRASQDRNGSRGDLNPCAAANPLDLLNPKYLLNPKHLLNLLNPKYLLNPKHLLNLLNVLDHLNLFMKLVFAAQLYNAFCN